MRKQCVPDPFSSPQRAWVRGYENNDLLADQLQGKLEDIPTALRAQVLKLGKLALEGALKQQITFEQLPDGCVDLGFMNITTELYLGKKIRSVLQLFSPYTTRVSCCLLCFSASRWRTETVMHREHGS